MLNKKDIEFLDDIEIDDVHWILSNMSLEQNYFTVKNGTQRTFKDKKMSEAIEYLEKRWADHNG